MDGNTVLQSFQYWEDVNNSSPSFSFRMPRDTIQVVKTQFSKQGLIRAYNNSISFIQTGSETMQFNGSKDQICEVLSTIFDCLITKDLFDRYLLPTSPLNTPATKPISNSPIQPPIPADSKDVNQAESILSKYQIFQTSNSEIEIEDKDRAINEGFKNQKLFKELNCKLSCLKLPPSASVFTVKDSDSSQLFDLTSQALSRIFNVNITESLLRKYTTSKPSQSHQPPSKQPVQAPPTTTDPTKSRTTTSTSQQSRSVDQQAESILSKYQIFHKNNLEIEIEDKDRKITEGFKNQKLLKAFNCKLSCLKEPPSASIFHVEDSDSSQLFDLTSQALSKIFNVNITESLLRKYTTSKPPQSHQPPSTPPVQVPPSKQPVQVPPRTQKSDKPDVLELDSKLYLKLLELCGLPPNSPSIKQIIFQPNTE